MMVETKDLAPIPQATQIAEVPPMTAEEVLSQVQLIQKVMQKVMKEGEHYGKIPGCGDKPALLKAGAEKLCLTFRLDPQYEISEKYEGDHLTVTSKCTLYHVTSGRRMGSGMGSCSTKESKYAYRKAERVCPACGSNAIIKGKAEYGGGWLCWKKKGGCDAKFQDGDETIEGQTTERVENEDKADQYNTVLKMANKRSLVAATLNVTAASDIFTQDIEDQAGEPQSPREHAPPRSAPPSQPEASHGVKEGDKVTLEGHECKNCGKVAYEVRKGRAHSKNPGKLYLVCADKNCKEGDFQTFGGFVDQVMAKYTEKGAPV